jgi:hypothetical protein
LRLTLVPLSSSLMLKRVFVISTLNFQVQHLSEFSTLTVQRVGTWFWLTGPFQTFLGALQFLLTSLHVFALIG